MRWMAKRDPCVPVAPPPHAEDRGGQEGDGAWGRCCPRALTLVVERVGQLVPHHHADAAKIKGSVEPRETEPGKCRTRMLSQPAPGPGPPLGSLGTPSVSEAPGKTAPAGTWLEYWWTVDCRVQSLRDPRALRALLCECLWALCGAGPDPSHDLPLPKGAPPPHAGLTWGGCGRRREPAGCRQGRRSHSWWAGSRRSRSAGSCSTWGRRWDRGQAGMCPLSPLPRHPSVPCPTASPLCCPSQGWHCCPPPHDQGTLFRGPARATTGDLQHCAVPWMDLRHSEAVPPQPCWGQCCDTSTVSHPLSTLGPAPYWSRFGGFRSWSAITLAEKL